MNQGLYSLQHLIFTQFTHEISLMHYLIFTSAMFGTGLMGILLNRKNLIMVLMAVEVMLLAVNCNFIVFSYFLNNIDGQVMVFFILAVAATESAIGLAILILLYNSKKSIEMLDINELKD